MKDVKGFIAAERARLDAEFEPGVGRMVPNGRMLDEQSRLLDRLEAWLAPRPFDRQRIYAVPGQWVTHLFDTDSPDRTLCGRVQDPTSALQLSMLQFMSTCGPCDEEFGKLLMGKEEG